VRCAQFFLKNLNPPRDNACMGKAYILSKVEKARELGRGASTRLRGVVRGAKAKKLFWFGVTYTFTCPRCSRVNRQYATVTSPTDDPEQINPFLNQEDLACRRCRIEPRSGTSVMVNVRPGTIEQLRRAGFPFPGMSLVSKNLDQRPFEVATTEPRTVARSGRLASDPN
jgi:hypothetical protein